MKAIKKIPQILMGRRKRRGFGRIDLVVLLLLGIISLSSLFFHNSSSISTTHALTTNRQMLALASPRRPCIDSITCSGPTTTTGPCLADPNCLLPPNLNPPNTIAPPVGSNNPFFFFTNPALTVAQPQINTLWKWILLVVDICIVVVLMLQGLRIMIGGSVFRHAAIIEALPGVLLALIAAQFSLGIATLFINLNNSLTVDFYNQANKLPVTSENNTSPNGVMSTLCQMAFLGTGGPVAANASPDIPFLGWYVRLAEFVQSGCDQVSPQQVWSQLLQQAQNPPNLNSGPLFFFHALTDLLQFIVGIMVLILLGQIVIRLFFIDLYIVLAPLGIACWALPGRFGQHLTRLWLQGFFSTLFAQFVQVAALIVLRIMVGAITSDIYGFFNPPAGGITIGPIHFDPNPMMAKDPTILWVVQIAQYWFLIRIPSILGTSSTSMIVNFAGAISQAVSTAIMLSVAELQMVTMAGMAAVGAAVAR